MKRWHILLMVTMALLTLLVSTPITAYAQGEEPTADEARPALKGALAIVAPWSGFVGQELTMTVFLRENQEPFPGAGVWAITREEAEALKDELAQLKVESNQPADEQDYEKIVGAYGFFLGRTGENGKLAYTFGQAGQYILVAAKKGYLPGFTHIGIRESVRALGIQAPRRVPVGEKVTITVVERLTQEEVEGAGVWAITQDKIETLKAEAQALREDTSIPAEEKDYEALVGGYGFFLGETDKHGKLDYTFTEAGGYLLVAIKRGYVPGFAPLGVYTTPKALGIQATPPQAHVGKEVTLHVFDRQSNDPVQGAGVWAITRDNMEALRAEMAALREDKSTAVEEKDYEAVVSAYGSFLGMTGADGKLSVTFAEPGTYVLVAVKRGYIPGFAPMVVKEMPQPESSQPEEENA